MLDQTGLFMLAWTTLSHTAHDNLFIGYHGQPLIFITQAHFLECLTLHITDSKKRRSFLALLFAVRVHVFVMLLA